MDTLNDIISGLKWGNLDPTEAHDRVLALFSVSQQREQLIAYHMNTLFDQKSEDNRKFVEAAVDVYLSNL